MLRCLSLILLVKSRVHGALTEWRKTRSSFILSFPWLLKFFRNLRLRTRISCGDTFILNSQIILIRKYQTYISIKLFSKQLEQAKATWLMVKTRIKISKSSNQSKTCISSSCLLNLTLKNFSELIEHLQFSIKITFKSKQIITIQHQIIPVIVFQAARFITIC